MKKTNIEKFFSFEKLIDYKLHFGNFKFFYNPRLQAYFLGFKNEFLFFNLNKIFNSFRSTFFFLRKIHTSGKKILFMDFPLYYRKTFINLCKTYKHQVCFSTDNSKYEYNKSKKQLNFSVIFLFNSSINLFNIQKFKQYNLPIVAFVNSNNYIEHIDYPLFANLNLKEGCFFAYNFFKHLFLCKPKMVKNK